MRPGVATLMGAILGVDREPRQKPAGVRVLGMVALGAALATIASITSGLGPWVVTATAFGLALWVLIGGRWVELGLMNWSRNQTDRTSP